MKSAFSRDMPVLGQESKGDHRIKSGDGPSQCRSQHQTTKKRELRLLSEKYKKGWKGKDWVKAFSVPFHVIYPSLVKGYSDFDIEGHFVCR